MWHRLVTIRPARFWMALLVTGLAVWTLGPLGNGAATAFGFQGDAEIGGVVAEPAPAGGAAPAANSADTETIPKRSFLGWLVDASGIFGLLLLLLSFVMVALIMMNVLQVRREVLLPTEFVETFEQKLDAKDYQGAYDAARNDDSFLGRVLAAGLAKLNRGYNEAIEAMQEVGEEETMDLEHRLSYLALIGSIAPMIGLMGTVYGMIISFEKIATSPVQPSPSSLAEGISMALFTTLEGLTVALPAMVFYSFLRNRMSRLMLEVGIQSESLMARFSNVGKPRAAGGVATAVAPKV